MGPPRRSWLRPHAETQQGAALFGEALDLAVQGREGTRAGVGIEAAVTIGRQLDLREPSRIAVRQTVAAVDRSAKPRTAGRIEKIRGAADKRGFPDRRFEAEARVNRGRRRSYRLDRPLKR